MKKKTIAIDGPSAAGKSTIAKRVAKELDYTYIDTGAMYRSVALACLRQGIDLKSHDDVIKILDTISIDMKGAVVLLNGEDVSDAIRVDEVSMGASLVSQYKEVRSFLVNAQREMAKNGGVILDGRDIGTIVLPDADVKIYQVASVETRALRRYKENIERGLEANLEDIKRDIAQRDAQDMNREESPLRKAEDAIEIDTSYMSIEEVVNKVLEIIQR